MKKTRFSVKMLAGLMAMLMCVSCFAIIASAAPKAGTLTVDNTSAAPGELVEFAVKVSGNPGVAAMDVEVDFDDAVLTPVSVKAGKAISGKTITSNIDVCKDTVTAFFSGASNVTANGEFLVFTFKVDKEAKVGSATYVSVYCTDAANQSYIQVKFTSDVAKLSIADADVEAEGNGTANGNVTLKKNASKIKYMAGYDDGTFRPTKAATRYEVVEAFDNLFTVDVKVSDVSFKDVNSQYKAMVARFAAAGVLNGYPSDNTFRGTKTITRAEFAKIICVLLDLDVDKARDQGFKDIKGHWAADYINACAAEGLLEGKGNGRYDPDSEVKRSEVVTVINRITGAKAGTSCAYSDVDPKAWYFGAVAAAAK